MPKTKTKTVGKQSRQTCRVYRSFGQYLRSMYPKGEKDKEILEIDPTVFGVNLARRSLRQVRQVLSQG